MAYMYFLFFLLVAIAVIGGILATQWGNIQNYITGLWGEAGNSTRGDR